MAFFEWDISSLTSSRTTLYDSIGGTIYYGTLFGAAGLWIKLPAHAPAIGSVITTAAALRGNDGLYAIRSTTAGAAVGATVETGLQISKFTRGGRWILLDRTTANNVKMSAGAARKKLRLHYNSVHEYVPIVA
jgi:hypothetical protein